MAFLVWALMGLFLGFAAAWVLPDRKPGWIFAPAVVGVIGGVMGGILGNVFTDTPFSSTPKLGVALSLVGALIMLFIYWRNMPGVSRRSY